MYDRVRVTDVWFYLKLNSSKGEKIFFFFLRKLWTQFIIHSSSYRSVVGEGGFREVKVLGEWSVWWVMTSSHPYSLPTEGPGQLRDHCLLSKTVFELKKVALRSQWGDVGITKLSRKPSMNCTKILLFRKGNGFKLPCLHLPDLLDGPEGLGGKRGTLRIDYSKTSSWRQR